MNFSPTTLPGVMLIELDKRGDDRGFFARTWCREEFEKHGLNADVVQINTGFSPKAGTLRGLHWQDPPHAEVKIVRCLRGALYDVVVDVRPGVHHRSPSGAYSAGITGASRWES